MDLTDLLLKTQEREVSGSETLSRYDFQAHWGVAQLFDLHATGADYAVAFEFHDDIVIIDRIADPSQIKFYQIKGKSKDKWTINSLVKRGDGPGGKKASIAGKLFSNKIAFGDNTVHLGFVSNQPVNFLDEDRVVCCFAEAESFDTFLEALKKEHPSASDQDGQLFHYHRTPFDLNGYSTFIKGKIVNFIQKNLGDSVVCSVQAFYLTVLDECRKQSKNLSELGTLEKLLASKFVRKQDVDGWLDTIRDKAATYPQWSEVLPSLAEWGAIETRSVRRQWELYAVQRRDVEDRALTRLQEITRAALDYPRQAAMTLTQLVEVVFSDIADSAKRLKPQASDDWIRAMILYEYSI